jgi:hypothetical protein
MAFWNKILLWRIDRHKFKKIKKSLSLQMRRQCLRVPESRLTLSVSNHSNSQSYPQRRMIFEFISIKPSTTRELKQELKPPSVLEEDLYV